VFVVLDVVQYLGIEVGLVRIVDGSGLGEGSLVFVCVLSDLFVFVVSDCEFWLCLLFVGLLVVGFIGMFLYWFIVVGFYCVVGVVCVKIGIFIGVSVFVGMIVDVDGWLFVLVLMVDYVLVSGIL